ncbi:MAG: AMP-binding protein [Bacteroidetes bacterium]|nr:AMP-binding protein [Bacteroidota bacterium]
MRKITDLIVQNKNLVYYDINRDKTLKIEEFKFHEVFFSSQEKRLVFHYPDNSLDSVETFWALMKSPHAIAMLSPQLNPEFKIQLEELYKPYYIWDPVRSDIPGYSKKTLDSKYIFEINKAENRSIHPELKILLSTSGTTGSPKFVKLSESNLVENALSICDYLPIVSEDCTPLNLPMYYSYGLSLLTTNSINGGKIICSVKDILNREFWNEFEKLKFTSLAGVPYLYEVLNRIGFTKKQYPSLRYLTQAGGKLNTSLVEIFEKYGSENNVKFYVMYGATEATARMSYMPADHLKQKLGSIGMAIKNGKFIIDTETGELIYSGPNVFGGYAVAPDDLVVFEKIGQLHTGDIAQMDSDGFYYITGRLKRFVKLFGQRVNLDEVETRLKTAFGGKTFVCVGINDKYIAVTVNEKAVSKEEVETYIHQNLDIHPNFIMFHYLEKIPLTQNGKVDYTVIIAMYATE